MKLVIKGAYYYDREIDAILVPHYSGEFNMVDCWTFIGIKELEENYFGSHVDQFDKNPIKFEGREYYKIGYYPKEINNWELLSDLSDVEHVEEDFDW